MTDRNVAELCGVAERTVEYWKAEPAFRARVGNLMAQATAAALKSGITRKATRIRYLDSRHTNLQVRKTKLEQVMEERQGVGSESPIGPEGWLTEALHMGMAQLLKATLDIDKELREIEKQAAIECGQWVMKQDVELTRRDAPGEIDLGKLTDEQLEQLESILACARIQGSTEPAAGLLVQPVV